MHDIKVRDLSGSPTWQCRLCSCSKFAQLSPDGMCLPLQAIMTGPLVMAGLTDGSRTLQADPGAVAELLSPLPSGALVELRLGGNVSDRLRHSGRSVQIAGDSVTPVLYDSWQLRAAPGG